MNGAVVTFTSQLGLGGHGAAAGTCNLFVANAVDLKGTSSLNLSVTEPGLFTTSTAPGAGH